MTLIRIAVLLAGGLSLTACSPEQPPQDSAPGTPGTPAGATNEAPATVTPEAVMAARPRPPAAEPAPEIDPDPQVGVELPTPPVRVPEDPSPRAEAGQAELRNVPLTLPPQG